MLRRLKHIALSILLLTATTGIVVSRHYCEQFLVTKASVSNTDPCCDSHDCCHNEITVYQLHENLFTPVLSQLPDLVQIDLLLNNTAENRPLLSDQASVEYFTGMEPPPPRKTQTILSLRQTYLL